ncbi:MAG: polyamine ABC transporter substrate-binding protein, partial [Methylobacteriaceae bacterium]|nr:polyamine ABC transporter substrate-binding protein [Methylobacteriaceae bacterium]
MKHVAMAGLTALALTLAAPAFAQKTLTIGMAAPDIGQVDPHKAVTTQDKPMTGWVFNGLVRFKPGSADLGGLEPDLAESWEKNADGTVWTFKLRKGVKFHRDYGEMTSEDVVFSIRRAADP